MANYMFVLSPTEKRIKIVCPACAKRGIVEDTCQICHGTAIKGKTIMQYYIKDRPIQIIRIDRDKRTGILRYWTDNSEFFYETVYPELNKYVPNVPHGIHLCHDYKESAEIECERVNNYLMEEILSIWLKNLSRILDSAENIAKSVKKKVKNF